MSGIKVEIFKNRQDLGAAAAKDAAQKFNAIIAKKGEATAIFAAAPSQNEFLAGLIKSGVDFTKIRAFHMDEYIGLPADAPQGFGNFLDRALFKQVTFKEVHYLRGSGTAEEIIARYSALLEKYPPDIVCMGVGENGHLAFNDPPVADFNDPYRAKVVDLDLICRQQQVNDGCFAKLDDVPKQAITLTMSQLFAVPEILSMVPGPTKANAIAAMLEGPITTDCPASILRKHSSAKLYIDVQSAAKLVKDYGTEFVVGV